MSAELPSLVARLEAVATRLESVASGGGGQPDVGAVVQTFDEFLSEHVAEFVKLSNKIGGDVKTQAAMVDKAFKAQRSFIATASKHQQPAADVLNKLLKPTADEISAVQAFRERNRSSKTFNHLSALSEAVPAIGWVAVPKTPGPYVKEMSDAAQFYLNRVLKDHKGDQTHTQWVKCVNGLLAELQVYIKNHHTTGVTWNKSGPPATAGGAAPPPPSGGPAPPPPPPVQAPTDVSPAGGDKGGAGARTALFAEIRKGTGISQGLKKVTDDQKTHKNPGLRKTGPVPSKPGQKEAAAPTVAKPAVAKKKNPVFELQGGRKWIVEHQEDRRDLVISDAERNQTVYVYQCKNITLQVKGKCNAIFVDGCKKTAIVFDDAISTCEFVNCQSVQCQVNGNVPTVSIDKTDGCQVYLSKQSIKSEIITSKSSEMNIMIPKADGDYGEHAIPEQFKTTWNGKALVTECSTSI